MLKIVSVDSAIDSEEFDNPVCMEGAVCQVAVEDDQGVRTYATCSVDGDGEYLMLSRMPNFALLATGHEAGVDTADDEDPDCLDICKVYDAAMGRSDESLEMSRGEMAEDELPGWARRGEKEATPGTALQLARHVARLYWNDDSSLEEDAAYARGLVGKALDEVQVPEIDDDPYEDEDEEDEAEEGDEGEGGEE